MKNVLILYAPQNESFKTVYLKLESFFSKSQYRVKILSAKEASIPDLSAADIIIFGSGKNKTKAIHSDYNEIVRSAQGINLAGRVAGFLSFNANDIFNIFKAKFKDSDIAIFPETLEIDVDIFDEKTLSKWTDAFIKFYKEYENGRF
ncbi:MAG: hypothetical protein JXR70_18160 [Spirochaetales bacterium]|nr:hypothetical protein [Spirochaetales bacterium]